MNTQLINYVPTDILEVWSPQGQVLLERTLWIAVYEFHSENSVVEFDQEVHDSLLRALPDVDLKSIHRRELVTRHDLKARLEEYLAVAAVPEVLHLGMTSADVVDNVALVRMALTLQWLGEQTGDLECLAWQGWLPFRGIKGAVGTQQDQLDLLGTADACNHLDAYVADRFDFKLILGSVGQVYPRSVDLQYAQCLHRLASAHPATRVLSSGYLQMAAGYAGDQWNEGDVSTSVVRRLCLPGLSFAAAAAVSGALPTNN